MKAKKWVMKNVVCLCAILLFLTPSLLLAQQYPARSVTITQGAGPGSAIDISVRALATATEKYLGQPFTVVNSPGGGGSVAWSLVAKQRPDGYHLMGNSTTGLLYVPHIRSVPYKAQDFAPILIFLKTPHKGIMVRSDSPWKTLKEFVEYAKKNPGRITYGHGGVGQTMHVGAEAIAAKEGIQWTGVPYKTVVETFMALLGGHVDMVSTGIHEVQDHIKAGKARVLAILDDTRCHLAPEAPTLLEAGYNFSAELFFLIAAPKGTPPPVVKKLDEAFRKGMNDPQFTQAMKNLDAEIFYKNSEDTKKYIETASVRIGQVIKDLKIPTEKEK